jgi:hypothetical protein
MVVPRTVEGNRRPQPLTAAHGTQDESCDTVLQGMSDLFDGLQVL